MSPRCLPAASGPGRSTSSSTTGTGTPTASPSATSSTSTQGTDHMERIIKAAVERGAAELHIKAGDVFRARIHGKLVPLTKQALTPEQTRTIALHLMSNEDDKARIDKLTDYDC